MDLGGVEHSTLQGGKQERKASQEQVCYWEPEKTFHSARCSMEDMAGMRILWENLFSL